MNAEDELVRQAARLLETRIGLRPDPSFRPRLGRALRDLAVARGTDAERLATSLGADPAVLDDLTNRVTVQETAFFRHPEQFDALTQLAAEIDAPLNVWSAACANGQEAYSLAMIVDEHHRSGSVLATDISAEALRRTTRGRYSERELHGVSDARRRRFFSNERGEWQVGQTLRDIVTIRRHNLLEDIPAEVANCQFVLCRNILIYLSPDHAERLLGRLADAMQPNALLFIGGAETLWHMTDRFESVQIGSCYAFRRAGEKRTKSAGPARPSIQRPSIAAGAARAVTSKASTTKTPAAKSVVTTGRGSATLRPSIDDVARQQQLLGLQLLDRNDPEAAAVAFRQWAYASPDDPTAHFSLGSALDVAGHVDMARRAYRAALAALDRTPADQLDRVLHGYDAPTLRQLLVERSTGVAPSAPSATTTHTEGTMVPR